MHPDEEQIQRFVHGELDPAAAALQREHVAACARCRGLADAVRLEEAEVDALLARLDHDPPQLDIAAIVASRTRRRRGMRWAAAAFLTIGAAGAAAAMPGSPVRAWLVAVLADADARDATAGPVADAAASGMDIDPKDGLTIVFTVAQPSATVTVALFDGTHVTVRAIGGTARFSDDIDRLVIDNAGSTARFEIRIPRAAPRVEIRVGGARLFLKDGSLITARPRADARGVYVLPLRAPAP